MKIVDFDYLLFHIKLIFFSDKIINVANCDSVRYCYANDVRTPKGFVKETALTGIIDLDKSLDILWNNLNGKVRQKIRKANELGIKIKTNQNYQEFYEINNEHRRRLAYKGPLGFDMPIDFMKKNGYLMMTELDGDLLSGDLLLMDDKNVLTWILASDRFENHEKAKVCSLANSLLIWEGIKYCNLKGIKKWDWGGVWSQEECKTNHGFEGINQFKLGFGSEIKTKYNYIKMYSNLLNVGHKITRVRTLTSEITSSGHSINRHNT
jgi:hypothetical protein